MVKNRQPSAPEALPAWIDGNGGILPAVLLTSTITWDGADFANLGPDGIQEVNRILRQILKTVIAEVGMAKLQQHLDIQAKKAVQQATQRMLRNQTSRAIVAEEVAENEQALEEVAKNKKARAVVAKEMSDEELLAEMQRRGLAGSV